MITCVVFIYVITLLSTPNEIYLDMTKNNETQNQLLLIGQFNYNLTSKNISTWIYSWSKVFDKKNIIMAVPDCDLHDYPKMYSQNYLCYRSEESIGTGWFSPYQNIIKILKTTEWRRFLYVHDDMLIKSSLLKKLGNTYWALPKYAAIPKD